MELHSLFSFLAQSTGDSALSIDGTDFRAILPALVLFLTAGLVLVIDLFLRGWHEPSRAGEKMGLYFLSLLGTVVALALACASLQRQVEGTALPDTFFSGAVRVDAFSDAISVVILAGTFLSLLASIDYLRRFDIEHGEYHALLLVSAGAMILFAQSNNLIMLFLSIETLSMAVYILSGFTRDQRRSVEGALKYFVLGSFSSGFLLLGFTFLYGATGQLELEAMVQAIRGTGATPDVPLLVAGLTLSLVGLGFKVGAFPFHSWIPDAYEGAPAVVSGFMAVTVKSAAFAILLRLVVSLVPTGGESDVAGISSSVVSTLSLMAVLTMIFGNLVALRQASVKRMLAYSAIAHTGYLLVGVVAALSPSAAEAGASGGASVVFYLLPYLFMTVAGFTLLGVFGKQGEDRELFEDYRGLAQERPGLALALLVILVSFAGVPPFAGFWAKFHVFRDAVLTGHVGLALVGVLTSIVSIYYYLRLVVNLYMRPRAAGESPAGSFPSESPTSNDQFTSVFVIAVAAAAVVILGVFPDLFYALSEKSVRALEIGLGS